MEPETKAAMGLEIGRMLGSPYAVVHLRRILAATDRGKALLRHFEAGDAVRPEQDLAIRYAARLTEDLHGIQRRAISPGARLLHRCPDCRADADRELLQLLHALRTGRPPSGRIVGARFRCHSTGDHTREESRPREPDFRLTARVGRRDARRAGIDPAIRPTASIRVNSHVR